MMPSNEDANDYDAAPPSSEALWLGWEATNSVSFGFATNAAPKRRKRLIRFRRDSHAITFAPTGTGKGTGAVIPNLLTYDGSCVVVDVKNGELTRVTARRRRELGQQVVVIDPFGITGVPTGGLNPFSVFDLAGAQIEADAEVLAEICARGLSGTKEPFWDNHGGGLLSGVLAHIATLPSETRTFSKVFDFLQTDDTVYTLATLLDTVPKTMPRMAYREIAAFLQMPDITRGGVLATTQSYLKNLHNTGVLNVLDQSSFAIQDLVSGKPMTIYIVLPVDRLRSHRSVLKLLLGVILKAIVSRQTPPEHRTLLLIDECAQLGNFPFLETFITLCRSFGCWVWTFWQDLAQLQTHYPTSWKTILNNCGVIQAFGMHNRDLAEQWSGYFDSPPEVLRQLKAQEQMLLIPGRGEVRSRRLNYLTDRRFAGMFDANPYHTSSAQAVPVPPMLVPTTRPAAAAPMPKQVQRRPSGGGSSDSGPGQRPR